MRFDTNHDTLPRSRAGGHVPAAALPVLLAAALSWWPASPSAAQAADDRRPSRLESTVDASIIPGDDFFAYANGGWLKATALPAGKERWGARDELEEETRRRIAELLDAASARRPARRRARWRTSTPPT